MLDDTRARVMCSAPVSALASADEAVVPAYPALFAFAVVTFHTLFADVEERLQRCRGYAAAHFRDGPS